MFRGAYQKKLLTILFSGGSNPLEMWDIKVRNGWTRRVKDEHLGNIVFEIAGTNVATAYIVSPPDPRGELGITLPFFTILIKNLKRYFTFEIQVVDDVNMRRRFRFSNYQSASRVRPFMCTVPLTLKPGWNQMQLNLASFTARAYGTNYVETQRVQIHANCRLRRVYFSNRLYGEEELPKDYRVYVNLREATRGAAAPRASVLKHPSPAEPRQSDHVPLERISSKEEQITKLPSAMEETPSTIRFAEASVTGSIARGAGEVKRSVHPSQYSMRSLPQPPVDDSGAEEVGVLTDHQEVERQGSKTSRRSVVLTPLAEEGDIEIEPNVDIPEEMLTNFPSMAILDAPDVSEVESSAWGEEVETEPQETLELEEPRSTITSQIQTLQVERQASKSSVVSTQGPDV